MDARISSTNVSFAMVHKVYKLDSTIIKKIVSWDQGSHNVSMKGNLRGFQCNLEILKIIC